MKRRCLFLLMLVFLLLVPIVRVDAKTLQDMYDQLADLQVKYNNSKNNLCNSQFTKCNSQSRLIFTCGENIIVLRTASMFEETIEN